MARYSITRKDDNPLIIPRDRIETTTEIQAFETVEELEDFCWEISDKRTFTITWVELKATEILKLSIISYQPEGLRGEWRAIDQNSYDGSPDGNNSMGSGDTALQAVADLIEQLEAAA